MRWIRLRFLLYALILAFLAVKLLGGNGDAGGADVELERLDGWFEYRKGDVDLWTSDGRVKRASFELALPCNDMTVQVWRYTMGTATLAQRRDRFSARIHDHSPPGEAVPWRFHGWVTATVADGSERARGHVHMDLRYTEPGGRTRICATQQGEYWQAVR